MSKKSILSLILLLLCSSYISLAQYKYEREYRIRKAQFPESALGFLEERIKGARQIRFYKETDSTKVSFEAKFKKDRLRYSIEFDQDGKLEDVEIRIKEVDIPEDSFEKITAYFQNEFKKYRIRRMQQQYPLQDNNTEETLKIAFQNLLIPWLNYEFIVEGKKEKKFEQYEVLFDAAGNFLKIRKSLPPNYDHVLY